MGGDIISLIHFGIERCVVLGVVLLSPILRSRGICVWGVLGFLVV